MLTDKILLDQDQTQACSGHQTSLFLQGAGQLFTRDQVVFNQNFAQSA